jgi:hypothetical protein
MMARELPLDQPGRFTISCMTDAIFGVRWSGPASPTVHGAGDHDTEFEVLLLDEMFPLEVVNVAALSFASPSRVSDVATEWASSAVN